MLALTKNKKSPKKKKVKTTPIPLSFPFFGTQPNHYRKLHRNTSAGTPTVPGLEKWVVWNIFSCVHAFADVGKELVFERRGERGSLSAAANPSKVIPVV